MNCSVVLSSLPLFPSSLLPVTTPHLPSIYSTTCFAPHLAAWRGNSPLNYSTTIPSTDNRWRVESTFPARGKIAHDLKQRRAVCGSCAKSLDPSQAPPRGREASGRGVSTSMAITFWTSAFWQVFAPNRRYDHTAWRCFLVASNTFVSLTRTGKSWLHRGSCNMRLARW